MSAPLVLVTGVTGYVGSWVAYAALKVGYRVRGTVRSLKKKSLFDDFCPGSAHNIELVEADLTSDNGWDAAVAGCDYILHVASPFVLEEPKNENEIIRPAVDGTLRVLRAASKMDVLPKRIILTASAYTIFAGRGPCDVTDDLWAVLDDKNNPVSAYAKSKVLAEKAAWDFLKDLPADKAIEMAVINPSFIMGPMRLPGSASGSFDFYNQILTGKMPLTVDVEFACVSVFDVARAHILAMTVPEANGKRFLLAPDVKRLPELAAMMVEHFKSHGYKKIPTMQAPNFLIRIMAFFGESVSKATAPSLGMSWNWKMKNSTEILGLTFPKEFDMYYETALAAIANGIIPDLSADQKLTKDYVRPEFDTSMLPKV
mmetsp:Transcript_5487/g.5656  ORF Transcript_5487/g.5656 Transcript_5487/m.5656 type:complete len:371 (+) Transcript_5487:78-1190(+)|eukprot:CAMPEP_0182428138 /NCGR_PEP_ID=MMETSP1167-20130531/21055_1 /TAXON_ID=2988 /ORGANISM="Mallomonas Sp, Strain CCMP3275" /LENGTH=370 /DNA_ID=CAMNT_0024610837 /DNA_START=51 /DNA_END=1163 /DNA_ORIENTATION=-